MTLPVLFALPLLTAGGLATELSVYVSAHAAHITGSAALTAARTELRTKDADEAIVAALRAGAEAEAGRAVRDFFRRYA
jgi:hypothetical protein